MEQSKRNRHLDKSNSLEKNYPNKERRYQHRKHYYYDGEDYKKSPLNNKRKRRHYPAKDDRNSDIRRERRHYKPRETSRKYHYESGKKDKYTNYSRSRTYHRRKGTNDTSHYDRKKYDKRYHYQKSHSRTPSKYYSSKHKGKYYDRKRSRSGSNCLKRALQKQSFKMKYSTSPFIEIKKSYDSYYDRKNYKKAKSISSRSASSSSSSSSSKSSTKDLGHFRYKIGDIINDKYKIENFLGDGTFGRVLECFNLEDNQLYAVKVIRPVERYIESAKIEADIILDIMKKDKDNKSHCVKMLEYFYFKIDNITHIALVFERLGKSLYDFIKSNKYRGYPISSIQEFARQMFEGMSFLHDKMELTHTDLKPENLLLKYNDSEKISNRKYWPNNVLLKEERDRSNSPSTRSYSKESEDVYYCPKDNTLRIIDFGGATYRSERHSDIINTRQYRAPEVILGCCEWDEKSDIWSLACILVELYTGELFFPTHDNEEHLVLIEKACGPIPFWMADNCRKEFSKIFYRENDGVKFGHRVNTSKLEKRKEVEKAKKSLETLEDLIHEDHKIFKDFLSTLFIVDPRQRPSCRESLNHEFFKQDYSNKN